MKILFDTNVLVAAILETHSKYPTAIKWLSKAKKKEINGIISVHTIAELYCTLTKIPIYPKIPPTTVNKLIKNNVLSHFSIIEFTSEDYQTIINILSQENIQGGAVYDALIAHAALKAGADKLFTFNVRHFRRVYPSISKLVEEPH